MIKRIYPKNTKKVNIDDELQAELLSNNNISSKTKQGKKNIIVA